jgi:hypothetical protein
MASVRGTDPAAVAADVALSHVLAPALRLKAVEEDPLTASDGAGLVAVVGHSGASNP